MIDYTKFPLTLKVNIDRNVNIFTIENPFDKTIEVIWRYGGVNPLPNWERTTILPGMRKVFDFLGLALGTENNIVVVV